MNPRKGANALVAVVDYLTTALAEVQSELEERERTIQLIGVQLKAQAEEIARLKTGGSSER